MKPIIAFVAALATLSPTLASAAECQNTAWKRVQERGVLTVGVKADYKPWGYLDTNGATIGLEPDLAQDLADTLGVKLDLVNVQSSNRMQFLEQGRIDVMIATLGDRPDRREMVGIVTPSYYSSGTNVLSPKALGFKEWTELSGKPVCGIQGSFYNKIVEDKYNVNIVAFGGASEAKQALKDKKCVALVYDDASLMETLASGGWDDFEIPLNTEDASPWGIAVPLAERDCVLGRFVSGMIYSWHESGKLVELESKWNIQSTEFVTTQHDKFKETVAQ